MITQEILESFVYQTMDGQFMATDPGEFDQVIPGGPWGTKEEAEVAFTEYVKNNGIIFE
jgi:hypothetical protein